MNILNCVLLTSLLLSSPFLSCVLAAPPAIPRQMEIVEATLGGVGPETIDPVACYDYASGGLIMNIYETLVFFDGERVDKYIPQLADNWVVENITGTVSPDGLPWYFRYIFHIRPNVHFWNGEALTPEDVEYSFERAMVLESNGGPQWMFYEPLLNTWGALGLNVTALDGNSTEQARVGAIINHSVESNSTHVWFNLSYPGAYAPFMQILSQTLGSIYSKVWAISLGRATNWDGDWADWYGHWLSMRNYALPPFDDPTPVAMGTGPFMLEEWNKSLMQWSLLRNHNYWRGWPLDWPAFGSSKPAGYIERYVVTWAYDWNTMSTMFLSGDIDICFVAHQDYSQILNQPGIRCIYPLPSLSTDALFYNFNIDPSTPYGTVYDYGVLGESGIPRDFFNDVNVRKAFSHLIDFTSYLNTTYHGEDMQPPTAIIPGLPYYNASIPKYDYNLATAKTLLQTAWGGNLWGTGFTLQLPYQFRGGSIWPYDLLQQMARDINSLNPRFHVTTVGVLLEPYFYAWNDGQLPTFATGWSADYPDPHNFAYTFYYGRAYGRYNFAWRQAYSNPAMDDLIELGIRQPDGPARAATYSAIQQLAIDDCPCIPLSQPFDRHFERTWVCGWYYNPTYQGYSGVYVANLWKGYYTPHAQLDAVTNATSNLLPYDVNYDGKINMFDIGAAAASFGAIYGPPISPKWNFRCDFNNDRKIDMKDISGVAQNFGKTSSIWTPSS